MDVQAEKLNLIAWISQVNNSKVIEEFQALKTQKESDWWSEVASEQKEDIDIGLLDLKACKKTRLNPVS